ncbi:MAG: hypothetical protein AAF558_12935 [Verrucomicrobiota bacterium]
MIYWMADFNDSVEGRVARRLGKALKNQGIRVIQHDFDGKDQLTTSDDAKFKKYLYETTGGEVIIGSGK